MPLFSVEAACQQFQQGLLVTGLQAWKAMQVSQVNARKQEGRHTSLRGSAEGLMAMTAKGM